MSDKPSDSHSPPPGSAAGEVLQEEVQDYLDMLLTQATEKPEAQVIPEPRVSHIAEQQARAEHEQRMASAKMTRSLTMVGGTTVTPFNPKPAPSKTIPKVDTPRPFAEPVKPVALKVSVPEVAAPEVPAPEIATPEIAAPVIDKPEVKTKPAVTRPVVDKAPPAPANPQVTTPAPDIAEQAEPPSSLSDQADTTLSPSEWMDNGRPVWAQERFECLLFTVGGLALAVPLVELGSIYPMNEELTPIFGQIDWFMGLMPVKEHNIKTVNTAKVVMPERYKDAMKEGFAYVISINGVDWGLAVDSVSNAITLDPSDVRWRSERSKRPWLAGTVVEHMCALLDVSQLAKMFTEQNQSR